MKRYTSIVLAIILLLSSTNVTFAVHVCHGQVMESAIAFGTSELDCGMSLTIEVCDFESDQESSISRKCCDNHQYSIDTDDNFQTVLKAEFPDRTIEITEPAHFDVQIFELDPIFGHSGLPPPKVTPDFQIDFQSFLI
ncbi:MAG: hypothetical protein KDC83_09420 [Flavobacteriales bacterium]|nr:hypothetical protein [Flavobacteriales bacterium]